MNLTIKPYTTDIFKNKTLIRYNIIIMDLFNTKFLKKNWFERFKNSNLIVDSESKWENYFFLVSLS